MDWARKIGAATVCIDYLKSVGGRSSVMMTEVTKGETQVKKSLERFQSCVKINWVIAVILLGLAYVLKLS